MKDLPAAPWKNTNGFFIFWGLAEPEGVDVLSDGYIDKVRRMGEPWDERSKHVNVGKLFWWIRNPTGKLVFSIISPNLGNAIYKGHRLWTTYDLIRILAEFHLKHIPGSDVKATLNRLDTYKAIDLCSGKQYLYSAAKKCLYSIGPDRKNNSSTFIFKAEDSDFIIPINTEKQR